MLDTALLLVLVSRTIFHALVGNFRILEVIAFSDVLLHFGRTLRKLGN